MEEAVCSRVKDDSVILACHYRIPSGFCSDRGVDRAAQRLAAASCWRRPYCLVGRLDYVCVYRPICAPLARIMWECML